jgi:hypothetical protein
VTEYVSAWYFGGATVVGDKEKAVGVPITTDLGEPKWMKLPPAEAVKMARDILDKAEEAMGMKSDNGNQSHSG